MFRYLKEFLRNILIYRNEKFHCQKIQVWAGETCTLRCKNCSQLFPYIKPKKYDMDKVIEDLKKLLKHIVPEEIHIIGGEPFVNKDIGKLIQYVCKVNPGKQNKVVSNGSIIPDKSVLDILKANKEHIYITVSGYDCIRDRQEKFKQIMQENDIKCVTVWEDRDWYFMGGVGDNAIEKIKNPKTLYRNFTACWDKTCHTIADGELTKCPRMHNSPKVMKGEKVLFIEHLPIKMVPDNFIGTALVATCYTDKTYRESCKYCYGVSDVNNVYCKRAEQLKN